MSYSDNFPVLQQEHNWKKLIYFDAACTYLKSEPVIEAITQYYTDFSSCAGDRESSFLGGQVSEKIWSARKILRWFLGAEIDDYIVFTKGTTDSINILSASISDAIDTYIVTDLEHNSNYRPW
jgi:cysteine desulfurase/selenocysteine lyase